MTTERVRYRSVVADSVRWDGFAFRDGDVVISTPPKCGTTWMQRLVSLLVFDGPDLPAPIAKVSPWLDMQLAPLEDVTALLDAQTHRRFIKTHTPLDGLPYDERVRYVCVGRDPRDVAVSTRHHMTNMNIEQFLAARQAAVGLEDLAEFGLDKPGPRTPQPGDDPLLTWIIDDDERTPMSLRSLVRHASTFWAVRQLPNVALFHYSDLRSNLAGELHRLASYLGYDVTAARAAELARSATFSAMKLDADNVAPNADIGLWHDSGAFFHRGETGQWRELFTDAHLQRYEQRLAALAPPDLATWLHAGSKPECDERPAVAVDAVTP
jgi:aryl sulfotransferase